MLPAMIAGLDCAAVREGAASVLDRRWRPTTPAGSRRRSAPRCRSVLRARSGINITVLMPYVDRLDTFGLLVPPALGREPRQGRQGHDAGPRAGHRRPAQPGAALSRRAGRQALHLPDPGHGRAGRQVALQRWRRHGARLSRRPHAWAICCWPRPMPPPRRWSRTAGRRASSASPSSTSASMGALMMHFMLETIFAAASVGHRRLRPARGRGGQGPDPPVSFRSAGSRKLSAMTRTAPPPALDPGQPHRRRRGGRAAGQRR